MTPYTPYDEVYGRFLSKIKDYPLLDQMKKDEDFARSILYDYLLGAIANFTYGSLDKINDRDDSLEQFNKKLTRIEIEILAKWMVVEYLSPILISSDLLEDKLSSKDFRSFSTANLIHQISGIQKKERSEAETLMIENYYRGGFQ